MHFASPVPLWLALIVAAGIAGVAWRAYRRPLAPLGRLQRGILITLRGAALVLLLAFFCRPIVMRPPASGGDAIVPILVDTSRSMAIRDGGQESRLARAVSALSSAVVPAVAQRFTPEVFGIGDEVRPGPLDQLKPEATHSDLAGALSAVRDRFRGRRLAGIILVSDGADTSHEGSAAIESSVPVFTIGAGSSGGVPDREVVALAAGDPRLDQAAIGLRVAVVSRGLGPAPFDVRLSANGRVIDTRSVTPATDGAPIDVEFTVAPDAAAPTVYSAAIAPDPREEVVENNSRSVLVSPRGRKRRVLMLEGAPGFEHGFLSRALAADPDLEVDAIAKTGANDAGQDTFFVQAASARAPLLTSGFPRRREDLFAYDAVIIANVGGDVFTRAQLAELADFVSVRGGGLLVLGGLSFAQHGLIGTALETILPVELGDRRGGALLRSSLGADLAGRRDAVVLTPEGEAHPVMRIGSSLEETRKKWSALPPLASTAPLGGPRAGATVLAVASVAGGAIYPVVAVQAYGRGRSMIFGGEAAWRWRMMMPAADRSYEFFWRQAARWLAGPSPDPVSLSVPDSSQPGDALSIGADVRDAAFAPVADATVAGTVTVPGGETRPLAFRRAAEAGRLTAPFQAQDKGAYRVDLQASRAGTKLSSTDRWFYVGGSDPELADPRLNEGTLRRIARATGGRYAPIAEAADVAGWLAAQAPLPPGLEPHDLWQEPWMFALAVALLASEWTLRRRWGLR